MKKKTDKKKLIARMDKLFSEIIRSQGVCDRCGSTKNLQCAHVLSRRHLQTRWDLENAIPLCVSCHIFWQHKEPHEFVHWFDGKYGGKLYETLKRRSNNIKKINYETKYEELVELHKQSV